MVGDLAIQTDEALASYPVFSRAIAKRRTLERNIVAIDWTKKK